MKYILLVTAIFICVICSINAQIKVVGDDYIETLSAAKNYFEKDLVFDSLFQQIDFKIKFKKLYAWTNGAEYDECYNYSLLGDTFFIPKNIPLSEWNWNKTTQFKSLSFVIKNNDSSFSCLYAVPAGYYVVSGYVFCNGGALRKKYTEESRGLPSTRFFHTNIWWTDEERIKEAKECFLLKEQELKDTGLSCCLEYDYVILTSLDDSNIVFYCRGLNDHIIRENCNDKGFRFFNLKFYNEFHKHFVGKKIYIFNNGSINYNYNFQDQELNCNHELVKSGDIITDALKTEIFKILDSTFVVKDIVLKDDDAYCILEGEKTGIFSLVLTSIQFSTIINYWDDIIIDLFKNPYFTAYSNVKKIDDYNKIQNFSLINIDYYNEIQKKVDDICQSIIKEDEKSKQQKRIAEEIARKKRDQEYQRRKEQEESDFKLQMINKYGMENGNLIANRKIAIGMTKEMCRDAWGKPMNTYRTTTGLGQSEVWCYNYKTRVYFYNGKVVQIDD